MNQETFDNLGEAGAGRGIWERDGVIRGLSRGGYPWRSCWQGDFDLCGYRRPQSYFREAVWRGGCEPRIFTTHPEHYGESYSGTGWHWYDVSDSWTFPKEYIGKPVRAEVYTDAEEVEFLLNGKTIGRAEAQKGVAALSIPYEKGKLTARTYRKHVFCGESSLCTAGPASSVAVIPEKQEIMSDNRDLCYFDISILDEKGIRVPGEKQELTAVADGGELLCIFSGDPANEDAYTSGSCHAWDGRAVAVVRASAPGKVRLIVEAKGLRTGTAVVTAR